MKFMNAQMIDEQLIYAPIYEKKQIIISFLKSFKKCKY